MEVLEMKEKHGREKKRWRINGLGR
jgi:hypothetical protein